MLSWRQWLETRTQTYRCVCCKNMLGWEPAVDLLKASAMLQGIVVGAGCFRSSCDIVSACLLIFT